MKKSQHKQAMVALFLLGIMALSIVFVYAQTINISKLLMEKKSGVQSEASLDNAVNVLTQGVVNASEQAATDVYNMLLLSLNNSSDEKLDFVDTKNRNNYFTQYISRMELMFGKDCPSVSDALSAYLPGDDKGEFLIDTDEMPELSLEYDETTCNIISCAIKNIHVRYYIDNTLIKERSFDVEIPAPSVDFQEESIDLFDYCMIGMRGIYVTGQTSSFVGNIYAGTHSYEEGREAEIIYGEKDPYGGFNILTTQAGIFGDCLVSRGDVNLKGAFVLFGSEDDEITIYANRINDIENYPSKTEYTINGETYLRDGSDQFTNEEHYNEIVAMVEELEKSAENVSGDYASMSDASYSGRYQKIISESDVTINEDFTGVVITKGNVLIESGCNVEGFIYAGDRVYVYGNNNIVSNKDVVKELLKEEESENRVGSNSLTEQMQENLDELGIDSWYPTRLYVTDYLGSIGNKNSNSVVSNDAGNQESDIVVVSQ